MQVTSQDLLEQLYITDRDITMRMSRLELGSTDSALLVSLKNNNDGRIVDVVEELVKKGISEPEIERLVGDSETLSLVKHYLSNYIIEILSGDYDGHYILSRLQLGLVFDRIGLSPNLYIFLAFNLLQLLQLNLRHDENEVLPVCDGQSLKLTLEKIVFFDLSLIMDTHVHALDRKVANGEKDLKKQEINLEGELVKRTQKLMDQADCDPLTELNNRRFFDEGLKKEISRSVRMSQIFTLAFIDLDNFKQVNDEMGHQEGDRILRCMAGAMRKELRDVDLPARIGGDEFAIILSGTDSTQASEGIRRIMVAFDELQGFGKVFLSVGLASFDLVYPQLPEVIVKQADVAMYKAKETPGHSIFGAL